MSKNIDERAPIAVAFDWASRVTTISIGMIVPGVLGYWIDQRLRTKALFTTLGFGLGVSLGIWQLARLSKSTNKRPDNESDSGEIPKDESG